MNPASQTIEAEQTQAFARQREIDAPGRSIKKIPPDFRKRKINFSSEPVWYRRIVWRLKEDSQFLRSTVQFAFAILCAWIGYEFYLFMQWGSSNGAASFVERPAGAEGFLPISALMSLSFWIQTGIINNVHPASVFILLAIGAVSIFLKKAFCSWLCPVGTLSESLWMLGQKLFGWNLRVTLWLDYPLRSLKYLLLGFFGYSVFTMDANALGNFIYSPYNKVADIKMYLFFADISSFALWTILILTSLSIVIKNFWCRYLCPYGALLGFASFLSPLKITRDKSTCVDCELCTKACPASIKVHKAGRVWSDECMSCMLCTEVCPVKDTLVMKVHQQSARPVPTWVFGALVTGIFVAITGLAMLSGNWQNAISRQEYQRRFQELNAPVYQHFRGEVPSYGPND
jgi:polyferredoxin